MGSTWFRCARTAARIESQSVTPFSVDRDDAVPFLDSRRLGGAARRRRNAQTLVVAVQLSTARERECEARDCDEIAAERTRGGESDAGAERDAAPSVEIEAEASAPPFDADERGEREAGGEERGDVAEAGAPENEE